MQSEAREKPRLRGLFHEWAFLVSLPLGAWLAYSADSARETLGAIVFALSVSAMFGLSALYHRPTWKPEWRLWLRRLDHAGIYTLIAGTYTPVGLIVLHGAWEWTVLSIVWFGAFSAIGIRMFWITAPKWLSAVVAIVIGWVGVVALPEVVHGAGLGCMLLILLGGLAYSVGAAVYAFRRPDPWPRTFGYHEIFHLLTIVAVALQYSAIAFYVIK